MKTVKVPLKGTWQRDEFIRSRNIVNEINDEPLEFPDLIRCSFCVKEIKSPVVNVVDFGARVACAPCFTARYRNRRQIYKHFPVHPEINSTAEKYDNEAMEKAKKVQDKNVTQIRSQRSAVDETSSPKTD